MRNKVSVIIPTYNHARFIGQAIQSVLEQTYVDLEVIVIDDGSTDNTTSMIEPFLSDPRVSYLYQENQGLSASRNRGIAVSSGKYLNFLDADDYLHPHKIAEQVAILDEQPTFAFVYCDIQHVDEAGNIVDDYSVGRARRELSGDIFNSLILGGYFPPHTILVRRSALEHVGNFDTNLDSSEDFDLWLRLAGHGYLAYYIDKRLVYYRVLANSMSQNKARMDRTHLYVLRKAVECFPEKVALGIKALTELNAVLYEAKISSDIRARNLQEKLAALEQTKVWRLVQKWSAFKRRFLKMN